MWQPSHFLRKPKKNLLYGSWLSQVITVSAWQCNFVQQGAVIIAHPQYTQNPLQSMVWYGMVWSIWIYRAQLSQSF